MSTSYKTLFEVKLLHEFYLTDREGKSIFEINGQAERLQFLTNRYLSDFNNIESDVSFVLTADSQSLFKNYRLKLLNTYAGFRVVIAVNEKKLPAGDSGYEPQIQIPGKLYIPVMLVKNNSNLDSYTNNRMNRQLGTKYFFSNDSLFSGSRVFPSLSADAPAFNPAYSYEQGEIVKFAANDYREFYLDDANNVQWITYNTTGFANENDRLLLPVSFHYSFPDTAGVTEADFTIKDKNGVVAAQYHFSGQAPLGNVSIRVNNEAIDSLPGAEVNDELLYILEVTGNNGYSKTYKVVFYSDENTIKDCMGIVMINTKPADLQFNVFDNTGLLLTKKKPDGTYNPSHPVFEIRLKSRLTFWRYINTRKKVLKNGLHPDFLIIKNGTLVTKVPRSLTFTSTLFRKPDNSPYYLPNPEPFSIIRPENDKIYSDIMVPESIMFPLAP